MATGVTFTSVAVEETVAKDGRVEALDPAALALRIKEI
jgi:hypothetical protein